MAGIATIKAWDSAEKEASGAILSYCQQDWRLQVPPFQTSEGVAWRTVAVEADGSFTWEWNGGNESVRYSSSQEPVEILCL